MEHEGTKAQRHKGTEGSQCPRCEGTGRYARLPGDDKPCAVCMGTGIVSEHSPLPDTATLIRSLRSDVCPACGEWKKPHNTLCSADYCRLPRKMQLALYDRIGHGYEAALTAALAHLGATEFKTRPPARHTEGRP